MDGGVTLPLDAAAALLVLVALVALVAGTGLGALLALCSGVTLVAKRTRRGLKVCIKAVPVSSSSVGIYLRWFTRVIGVVFRLLRHFRWSSAVFVGAERINQTYRVVTVLDAPRTTDRGVPPRARGRSLTKSLVWVLLRGVRLCWWFAVSDLLGSHLGALATAPVGILLFHLLVLKNLMWWPKTLGEGDAGWGTSDGKEDC